MAEFAAEPIIEAPRRGLEARVQSRKRSSKGHTPRFGACQSPMGLSPHSPSVPDSRPFRATPAFEDDALRAED